MTRVFKGTNPPGQWSYPQPGLPQPIRGTSYEELITNITNARIHNHIPLGQPEKDFEIFFCAANPHLCNPISPQVLPERETDDPTTSLRERVASFAGNRYQYAGSISLENSEVADSRARVCESCPSKASYQDGCPCLEQIKRTLVLLTQNQKTTPNLEGQACSIAGHDLNAACFLTPKFLNHRKRYMDKLPDFCWLRTLEDAK